MGLLVNGQWRDQWYDTDSSGGRFVRQDSSFRDRVTSDGSSGFVAEPDRYHLYVSLACPWAHRTLIFRKIKGLTHAISISIVDPLMGENGWFFSEGPNCIPDPIHHAEFLHQIYTKAKSDYTGRVTVPILWDRQSSTIVNNESSEIIRMLNSEFNAFAERPEIDLYPEADREAIDRVNDFVYPSINNGVYRCGFATTQEAYEEAFAKLFDALDQLDQTLGQQRYLVGGQLTEADWRLFTTLVRFDPVYVGHFKCNRNRIADFPNLGPYLRELYQYPNIAETVNLSHIKRHYYESHDMINPTRIVPVGPDLDLLAAHDRDRFSVTA